MAGYKNDQDALRVGHKDTDKGLSYVASLKGGRQAAGWENKAQRAGKQGSPGLWMAGSCYRFLSNS